MHTDAEKKLVTSGAFKNIEWVLGNVIGYIHGRRSGIKIRGTCKACGGGAILYYINE